MLGGGCRRGRRCCWGGVGVGGGWCCWGGGPTGTSVCLRGVFVRCAVGGLGWVWDVGGGGGGKNGLTGLGVIYIVNTEGCLVMKYWRKFEVVSAPALGRGFALALAGGFDKLAGWVRVGVFGQDVGMECCRCVMGDPRFCWERIENCLENCLVEIARPRLERSGLLETGPHRLDSEIQLYHLLGRETPHPYGRYNSLLRELVSFERGLDQRLAMENSKCEVGDAR